MINVNSGMAIKQLLRCLLGMVLVLAAQQALAVRTPIAIAQQADKVALGGQVSVYEDVDQNLHVEEVIARDAFEPTTQRIPFLGLGASAWWVEIPLANQTQANDLILELGQATYDHVTFFAPNGNGGFTQTVLGEEVDFHDRSYKDPNFVFELNLEPGETATFYLRLQSKENMHLPLFAGSSHAVFASIKTKDLVWGIFTGIMLVMMLYNLFVWFSVRDRSYLWYVGYILLVLLTQTSIAGYTFQYLWPSWPWMAINQMFIFPCLTAVFAMLFMRVFLQTRKNVPKLDRFYFVLIAVYGIVMLMAFSGLYKLTFLVLEVNAGIAASFMLFVAVKIVRSGYRPARFFLFAWTAFLSGVLVYVSMDNGLLPQTDIFQYTMASGAAVETILLSFGLADRINALKLEKEASDAKALEALRENERIIREQNEELERKVEVRTAELREANSDLGKALDDLKETQAQLVQAEKMSSLGQLTAGIAHEINNSINFVTACTKPLKRDMADLLALLNKYDEVSKSELSPEKLAEIEQLKKQLEMEVLVEEIDSSLHSIDEGAHRTLEIAAGLKTFSRLDSDGWANADVLAGLESTLKLLETSLPAGIQIERDFAQVPKLYCQSGKLNQVFMNLFNNAISAIEDRKPEEGGQLAVKLREENGHIVVTVADNGSGMDEATRAKVFDPFFTTKDVGEGTGLGLSIAHGIINNHHGTIQVNSIVGVGTQFVISLPLGEHAAAAS